MMSLVRSKRYLSRVGSGKRSTGISVNEDNTFPRLSQEPLVEHDTDTSFIGDNNVPDSPENQQYI